MATMTWAELEQLLPNGFHDSRLDEIQIDYRRRIAVFEMELWAVTVGPENRGAVIPNLYRRGRLTFTGLLACTVDVPNGEFQSPDACELWMDVVPIEHPLPAPLSWPGEPLPEGVIRRTFYFQNDAASFVHLAAEAIEFEWLTEIRLLCEQEAELQAA